MKKISVHADLQKSGEHLPGGSSTGVVTDGGEALTHERVAAYLAKLSNTERSLLLIQAIRATKTGRRY